MARALNRLIGAVALVALTACGTTVPLAQQQAGASLGGDLGGTSTTGTLGGGTAAGAGTALDPGSATSSTTGSDGARSGALPPRSAAPAPGGTTPQATGAARPVGGALGAPLRVGVLYLDGADRAAAALGVSGLSTGDSKAQAKAVFDWVAAHGGLGGRKAEVFYYGVPASDGNPEAAQQNGCTGLVQDNHVQYVVSILNLFAATMACFAKAGVGVLDDASGLTSPAMSRYSTVFGAPGDFSADRLMKTLIDDLWARGWLNPKSKVGVYTYDTPDDVALVNGPVTSYLAAHGLTPDVQRGSNGASGANDASAAVIKFRSANVDRIIPVLVNPLFLMAGASSQRYYPAYAMYSYIGPGSFLESSAPADQLVNAAGIGYQTYNDIGAGTNPGPVSSNETLCFEVLRAAGQQSSAKTTKAVQLQLCNVILYLKALADTGTGGNLLDARSLLGTGYHPADTFRSDVRSRPDGAAGVRDLAYQSACSCFQYVSGVRPAT